MACPERVVVRDVQQGMEQACIMLVKRAHCARLSHRRLTWRGASLRAAAVCVYVHTCVPACICVHVLECVGQRVSTASVEGWLHGARPSPCL